MKPKSPLCFSHHCFRAPPSCHLLSCHPPRRSCKQPSLNSTSSSEYLRSIAIVLSYSSACSCNHSVSSPVSPVWRTTSCSSRGSPQSSPATTTRQNYNTLLIDSLYTKVADVLE
ncbi:hypothetical protein L207DRAFT_290985 [Hyaloscypha variabilis F]|uniref:Uncharacterized protein n=1 Tax=Hyaloscypha variabilis (strain UAMH 11265 / GT02V1 / F) TaxID=1149755 RepID=A0A2J6RX78_HYAVF|nr:hypothetical protein L207DRAFT_290985 [Hyaloscypha variabilis F]